MQWNCQIVRDQLGEHVRGYAPGETHDRIEQHLVRCTACRRALEMEEALTRIGRDQTPGPVPEGFAASVLRSPRRGLEALYQRKLAFPVGAYVRLGFRALADPVLQAERGLRRGIWGLRSGLDGAMAAVRTRAVPEAITECHETFTALKPTYKRVSGLLAGTHLNE